jgi:transcriptional regulator with XRE-family HTH domain
LSGNGKTKREQFYSTREFGNRSQYRHVPQLRGIKAAAVGERLGIKEAAYTRYERGEAALTVNIIQRVAEILKIDPISLLSVPPGSFIESGNNSTNTVLTMNSSNWQTTSDEQMKMTLKLIESAINLNEKLITLFDKE